MGGMKPRWVQTPEEEQPPAIVPPRAGHLFLGGGRRDAGCR